MSNDESEVGIIASRQSGGDAQEVVRPLEVHVSSTAECQIVLEFKEGSKSVGKGMMTITAALQVAHLLFDRVHEVAAEQDKKSRKAMRGVSG